MNTTEIPSRFDSITDEAIIEAIELFISRLEPYNHSFHIEHLMEFLFEIFGGPFGEKMLHLNYTSVERTIEGYCMAITQAPSDSSYALDYAWDTDSDDYQYYRTR